MQCAPGAFMIAALLLMRNALGADALEPVDDQLALRVGFARMEIMPSFGAQIPTGFKEYLHGRVQSSVGRCGVRITTGKAGFSFFAC